MHGVDFYDQIGDLLLQIGKPQADSSEDRSWHFESAFFNPLDQQADNVWSFVQPRQSEGFLFRLNYREAAIDLEQDSQGLITVPGGRDFKNINILLLSTCDTITQFLKGMNYLAPLREEPQRFYYTAGQSRGQLARRGLSATRTLIKALADPSSSSQVDDINGWFAGSSLSSRFKSRALDESRNLYELLVADTAEDKEHPLLASLREVGFGISQVLPVVVETVFAQEGSMLFIEQPELHLHPSAQAALADLFIRAVDKSGVRVLIETHSEHLLLRLRRRIVETSARQAQTGLRLDYDAAHAYFIDKLGGESVCQTLEFDSLGNFAYLPGGFRDFFTDDVREIMEISKAARRVTELEERSNDGGN